MIHSSNSMPSSNPKAPRITSMVGLILLCPRAEQEVIYG